MQKAREQQKVNTPAPMRRAAIEPGAKKRGDHCRIQSDHNQECNSCRTVIEKSETENTPIVRHATAAVEVGEKVSEFGLYLCPSRQTPRGQRSVQNGGRLRRTFFVSTSVYFFEFDEPTLYYN